MAARAKGRQTAGPRAGHGAAEVAARGRLRRRAATSASANCTPLKADGYAHHPYEFTEAPTAKRFPGADNAPIETLGRLRTALNKLASAGALSTPKGKPLDIYLTESGYFVTGTRKVAAAKRARWLPESFQVAAQQARVKEMLQYNVYRPRARRRSRRGCSRSAARRCRSTRRC